MFASHHKAQALRLRSQDRSLREGPERDFAALRGALDDESAGADHRTVDGGELRGGSEPAH